MEEPALPVWTVEQPKASPRVEKVPVDPMLESPVARWPMEESTATANGLGGGERLASTADGSATVPEATMETAESSGAEAKAADATLAFGAEGPTVPEEQTGLPEATEGVVRHAIRLPSP